MRAMTIGQLARNAIVGAETCLYIVGYRRRIRHTTTYPKIPWQVIT